jgi:hypothetical protein
MRMPIALISSEQMSRSRIPSREKKFDYVVPPAFAGHMCQSNVNKSGHIESKKRQFTEPSSITS